MRASNRHSAGAALPGVPSSVLHPRPSTRPGALASAHRAGLL